MRVQEQFSRVMEDESSGASHKEVTTQRPINYSQLKTEGRTLRDMRTTALLREATRCAGAKRDAQQASASGLKTDTFSILRDSPKHLHLFDSSQQRMFFSL